jgi:pimeloyl-ACP methyl ester carboxylesterase
MYQKSHTRGPECPPASSLASSSILAAIFKQRLETQLVKHSKLAPVPPIAVRTRRAYFDCKFGQLHVRTAFPTSGGFDEQVTLFCLHPSEGSSRSFDRFLPEIADERSVYAPDLPGFGESDAAPRLTVADAAGAISDLADDLRLRQIDVLGVRFGAAVALELGAVRPTLVRRLVLAGVPLLDRMPVVKQESLVLRIQPAAADAQWPKGFLPNAHFVELGDYAADLFDAAPKTLAKQINAFLKG